MKKTNQKNSLLKFFIVALALVVALSLAPLGQATTARADVTTYEDFVQAVTVEQGQFDVGDISSMPATPSSWTGDFINGANGSVKSGVLALNSTYSSFHEQTGLDIYPEYKNKNSIPVTPFGKNTTNPQNGDYYPGTNKNVLMINIDESFSAYGYTSQEITLDAHAFYSFSAWIKTGNFSDGEGAGFSILGLKDSVGIWNIDTVSNLPLNADNLPDLKQANNWGWKQYTIFVATGSASETIQLQLSVGDNIENHYYASNGYAFFDNITASKYSPTFFYEKTSAVNSSMEVYDMNSYDYAYGNVNGTQVEIGSFENGTSGWKTIYDEETGTNGRIDFGAYNAGSAFIENNAYGFEADPFTPQGKNDRQNNIMVLSTFNKSKDSFNNVQAGIISPDITIEGGHNYELSIWYNTQNLSGNAGVVISGESTQLSTQYKLEPVVKDDLISDFNTNRYGWRRADFYIKGSIIKDVKINVELWIGHASQAGGIAMFDDITLRELSSSEYNSLSQTNTTVIIDAGAYASTGVANGAFYEADYADQDELKDVFPIAPTSWTYFNASSAQFTGRSNFAVSDENAIYGIVPTNNAHYDAHSADYANIQNPYQHGDKENKNALLMYSPTQTILGYRSSSISISALSYNVLSVKMLAQTTGYGANLVLKSGSNVIGTIEQIKSTSSQFRTYDFYIQGGSVEQNVTIEIWLGLTDTGSNTAKRAGGYVFVDSVSLSASTEEVLTEKLTAFNTTGLVHSGNYVAYDFGGLGFGAFDRYSDQTIKDAYNYTQNTTAITKNGTIGGIISVVDQNQNTIPSYYFTANENVENKFSTSLYLKNNEVAYSKLSAINSITLEADTFYKIEFSVLVDLASQSNQNAIGAGLWLNSYGIENIRNTYNDGTVVGLDENGEYIYEYAPAFNTFTFYYTTGAEMETVNWGMSLGGSNYPNERVAGQMFCNYINVEVVDSYYFDEEIAQLLEDNDAEEVDDIYGYKLVDKRVVEDVEEDVEDDVDTSGTPDSPWYLFPSILFAIAVLVALVGVVAKKLLASVKFKKNPRTVSYDRKVTMAPSRKVEQDGDETVADEFEFDSQAPDFDSFDDMSQEDKSKQLRKERKVQTVEVEATIIDEFADTTEIESEIKPAPEKPAEIEIDEFDD